MPDMLKELQKVSETGFSFVTLILHQQGFVFKMLNNFVLSSNFPRIEVELIHLKLPRSPFKMSVLH